MKLYKNRFGSALVLVAGLLAGGVASATSITMNFDGLTPGASVDKYYDGGCSHILGFKANCDGQDYGVVWKNALVGSSANAPSPSGFAGLLFTDDATMNVKTGFNGGLSFYYYNDSNLFFQGGISVYSGLNGKGTQLSSANLSQSDDWNFFDLTFSGLAKSVIFDGSPLFFTGFDDVTLGVSAPSPVPEPDVLGMFGLGVLLMGMFAGFRRRHS
ncbi:MAG: PEP-CTERM sorting domain-containing protein [Rhodanobacter sp.]